jgi:amino acid adenylation domain-containing protein
VTIADLISNLKQLDIRLSAEGERLRVNAPKGVLTQGLRTQIAERKHELLQFLSDYEQSTALIPAPIIPRSSTGPAPLSFAQERLWFLEQLEPGNAVYNICRAWRLLGELNLSAIEASLNAIVRRHEVLRSSIRVAEGRPLQGVQPPFELNLFVLDLQAALDIERECEMAERIEQATEAPFDFAAGKFLRAELLRVAANEHVLILTTHHIVSDAWSMGILTRELWSLYVKYAAGKSSQLEELPVQYGDFAAWQREWLQGEVLERQVSYWKEQLKDLSHLNLPTDRPRSARQSFQAARSPITLPETLTTAIHELSDQAGVTPFMILLAAFQVLLYRYCGQEEIVVGSPIANRARTELEPLIGFFVNTLVLRSDLSGNPAFEELLARVREVCLGAYAHQDLPFEKLVQELQPERDPSRNPLFQVMLALQNATRPVSGIPDLRIEPLEIESTRSPFDLSVLLRERDGKYTGSIVYSTDLFNRDRIERMVRHFQTLLEGIIANPDQPISTLPILTDSERHQILIEWNDTAADYPRDSCIHELFEAQVERTPEAIAVHFEGKQLTYWELNVRANQLAHYLRGLGVGPEKLVGICVERSLEMVVGLLGILKAGGAYVPLDETYPTERLRFMLEDAQVSVLLTQRKVIEHGRWGMANGEPRSSMLDSQTIKVVYLHTIWETIAQESERNLRREVKSGSLAYLIYTSGSSGQPKGVMIPHRAICNHVSWMQTAFPLNNSDRVLGHASLCFDASVWELFVPLSNGARLVLAQQGSHQDLAYLVKLMAEEKVTVLQSVPSLLQMLLEENIECCTSLRHVFCGGEVLSGELLDRCFARLPGKLHNHYGPTEATIDATSWTCAGANDRHLVPIGRPIANTQVYILDSHIQPVPVGVPGELHIGGDGLARGYLNAPQLTAEKFISNPFSKEFGARLYKTGDLGRYLPNGHIEFSGRMDNQVKLRGYRIELPEIEKVLVQHPGVRDSVVLLQERTPRNKRLVAYVASKKERAPTVSELRTYVAEKLPAYMVPAVYVMLDAIPFLPNGKVDRQALPPPGDNAPGANETFVEPRTEVEKLLADIWLEVLHLERLGVHDNFFELGGHSLLAIQVISRAREIFHNGVSLRSLFRAPTVAGLAETIEGTIRGVSEIDLPTIDPVPRDRTLPLSMNQEQLWTLDQMMPDTRFFNIPLMYRIGGDLNTEALEKSLKEIIRRHEVLRTVFVQVDGRPVQVIKEGSSFELPLIDLRGITSDNQVNQLSSLILEERERSFDLAIGPLLRTKLVRLADRDYFFFLTAHHIVGDDWSMQLFRNELAVLYCAFSQGRPSPLPEPTIQFADYACWERRLIENGLFDEKLAYWRKQLSGPAPALDFEEKGIREKALSVRASEPIAVDETLYKGIKTLARRESCTVFMVLLTALNGLLHRYAHQQDIRIGALVANRGRREVEGLIGYFLNTVVLCTQVSPEMTIQQLLLQVRAVTLAAYIHQEVPFEQVARMLEQEENINRSSLFQVLFNYQGPAAESIQIPGLTFASLNFQEPTGGIELAPTMFDLIFDVRESSTKLSGSVNYKTGLFVNGVTCVIRDFRRILETMISEPKCRLSSISLD